MWTRRITVRGEVDCATVELLTGATEKLANANLGDSCLDLAQVSFLDATAVGCIVDFRNKLAARGAQLRVTGATARARRIFEIVGLSDLLADVP